MPLLPAGLALAGGIFFSTLTECFLGLWTGTATLFIVITPILIWRGPNWLATASLIGGFVASGGALHSVTRVDRWLDSPRALYDCGALVAEEPVEIFARLAADPELAPDRIYLKLELERLRSLQRTYRARGVVRMVVPFNDDRSRLEYDELEIRYGARLRLIGQLRVRREYGNPGAPPFDEILESQGLAATGWVRSPLLIERLDPGRRSLTARLYSVRSEAIRRFLRHLPQPAAGLLVASLFGNRYFLSRDAAEPFRIGGTFHLLVISGLHMTMIATVVFWLMRQVTDQRLLSYGSCLLVVWCYGVMVGAQPAVMRAVVMLTLVLAAQYLFRQLSGGNSLASAGLLLLAWEPGDLFDPGFQVSYLTVGVILFLTGPLQERWLEIGRWRPSALTPWPPRVSSGLAWVAEILYWDAWRHKLERRSQRVKFRLVKARPALWASRLHIQPILRWIVMTVVTTTGVQVALLPVMISSFHRVSLMSPLINIIEAVMVTAVMALGVLFLVVLQLLPADRLSTLISVIDQTGRWTVEIGAITAAWPGGGWRVPDFGPLATALYLVYGLALLIGTMLINTWNPLARGDLPGDKRLRRLRRLTGIFAASLIAVVSILLVSHPVGHSFEPGRLSLTFLDVGQGDSIVVSFPRGRLMMIDSGGDPIRQQLRTEDQPFQEDRPGIAEAAILPYLWSRGIDRLDWIVATHDDNDHIGGFEEITRNLKIGEALHTEHSGGKFLAMARASAIPLRQLEAGQCFEIEGVTVEVIAGGGAGNNGSLVIRLTLGRRSFLLTGDIEKRAEYALIKNGHSLKADVLKVAHHGSATSSTPDFLDQAEPVIAVISAGRNNLFGHPSQLVRERLKARGVVVYETAQDGAITISTNGIDLLTSRYRVDSVAVRQSIPPAAVSFLQETRHWLNHWRFSLTHLNPL